MNNQNKLDPSQYTAHLHPGKFQGETAATEYFYEEMLNGVGETIYGLNETVFDVFKIEVEEAEAFNLPINHYFLIWEDDQGFVYGEVYITHSEAVRAVNRKI